MRLYLGEEETAERSVPGLGLTPKRDRDREVITRIELWVDQASWLPARQVIERAGGTTLTARYTTMARNPALNPLLFKDRWLRGTRRVD